MDTRLHASTLAHLAIARAVYRGVTDDAEVDQLVEEIVHSDDPAMRTRVPKTLITQPVLSFLWHFDIRRTHILVGYEHPVEGGQVDLVWEHRHDASIVFDELKTGVLATRQLPSMQAQYAALYGGGRQQFGTAFVGVRQLTLLQPRHAQLRTAPTVAVAMPRELRAEGRS